MQILIETAVSRQRVIELLKKLEQEDIEQYGCKIPEGFDAQKAITAVLQLPPVILKPLDCVVDKIRAEIEMYEADCRLQGGTDECEQCNSNVFGTIYRIFDKYEVESR